MAGVSSVSPSSEQSLFVSSINWPFVGADVCLCLSVCLSVCLPVCLHAGENLCLRVFSMYVCKTAVTARTINLNSKKL